MVEFFRPREFAVDGGAANYAEQYTNLPGLVDRVQSSILSKLAPPPVKPSPGTASSSRVGQGEDRHSPPLVNPLIDERQRYPSPGIAYPPVPAFGGSDLYPSPGAGIFGPRLERGYDGMLLGPNDPRWGRMGGLEPGVGVPDTGGIGVVPGARFDPYGPPGVPGFERNRFARDPSRPPGGHPDLEHYSPGF
jgi:proteasome inhibitor subunit 1 (PI31)